MDVAYASQLRLWAGAVGLCLPQSTPWPEPMTRGLIREFVVAPKFEAPHLLPTDAAAVGSQALTSLPFLTASGAANTLIVPPNPELCRPPLQLLFALLLWKPSFRRVH